MSETGMRFCEYDRHIMEEDYYGHKCKNCDLFYAFGCAPWDAEQEPSPDDYCHFCGKEYTEFGDLGCEECDPRVFDFQGED